MTTTTPTTSDTLKRLTHRAERLSTLTGIKWTVGYIGNCDHQRDDRSWYLFADHEGRIGTANDRIGGVATEDLHLLLPLVAGALRLAQVLRTRGTIQ